MKYLLLTAALACLPLHAQQTRSGPWVMESSGTTAGLRGIHSVGNGSVAWASGTGGTILRTEDAGYLWQRCAIPTDAANLDFRGIWAWDENTAIVMSSGPGNQSRIYKTTDGCAHWTLLFTNPDKEGFWDAMVFEDRQLGSLLGDSVKGRIVYFTTTNGGKRWTRDKAPGLEADNGVTGAFAASNSALLSGKRAPTLFGSVGGYIYAVQTTGTISFPMTPGTPVEMHEQWTRTATPLSGSNGTSGIFSLGYQGNPFGYGYTLVAVGGDYTKPDDSTGTAAWSADGGKTWTAATKPPHGFRSAVAWDAAAKAWIAAGTNGSDVSYDDGRTWAALDNGNWNALSLPYIVGPNGRIARLDESELPNR